ADDLRRFLAGEPIVARPLGAAGRALKWAKRRPAVAALLALVALSLLGGTGGSAYFAGGGTDQAGENPDFAQTAQSAEQAATVKAAAEERERIRAEKAELDAKQRAKAEEQEKLRARRAEKLAEQRAAEERLAKLALEDSSYRDSIKLADGEWRNNNL